MFEIRRRNRSHRPARFVPTIDGLSARIAPTVFVPADIDISGTEEGTTPGQAPAGADRPTSGTGTAPSGPPAADMERIDTEMRDALSGFYLECRTTGIAI